LDKPHIHLIHCSLLACKAAWLYTRRWVADRPWQAGDSFAFMVECDFYQTILK